MQKGSNFCNELRLDLWATMTTQIQEGRAPDPWEFPGQYQATTGSLGIQPAQIIEQWPEIDWFLRPPGPLRGSLDQQGQERLNSCKQSILNLVASRISKQKRRVQCSIRGYLQFEQCQQVSQSGPNASSRDSTIDTSTLSNMSGRWTGASSSMEPFFD